MYFKTALSNIRRQPFQALAAVFVLAITFLVATLISFLIYSSAQIVNYFETRPQVIAFLKNDASDSDVSTLQKELETDSRITNVKLVTKDDALSIYKNATSDNPLLGQLVSPSIFPASLEFSVKDINDAQKVIDETSKEPIVDSVSFTASLGNQSNLKDVVSKLSKITLYIRIGGIVIAAILSFTSFLVLTVLISMRIVARRNEIETLKLMGATTGFISAPILVEALIYVFAGVLVGWACSMTIVMYAAPSVINYFGVVPVFPRQSLAFFELGFIVLGMEFFVGVIIAVLGGMAAITKAVHK